MNDVLCDKYLLELIGVPSINRITWQVDKYAREINKKKIEIFIDNLKEMYKLCYNKHDNEEYPRNIDYNDPFYMLRVKYTSSERAYWRDNGNYDEIRFGDLTLYSAFKDISLLLEMVKEHVHVTGTLNLRDNCMRYLSDNFISKFTIGKDLILSNSRIGYLPDNFGEINVGNNIVLYKNSIKKLPESIKNLKIKGELNLAFNLIEYLPESFCTINVNNLNLSHNRINNLPDTICEMNVNSLDLSWNMIEKLPDTFGKIKIDNLNLSGNRIKDLPSHFSKINVNSFNLSCFMFIR